MRARIWIFTVVVAVALALNLARVSLSIAQTGEDTMRARVAAASNALRGQLDLLDARLAPRAVAMMPDLIEAVRGGDGQSPARPDERALRAAGAVLSPEPDLFAVAKSPGPIAARRATDGGGGGAWPRIRGASDPPAVRGDQPLRRAAARSIALRGAGRSAAARRGSAGCADGTCLALPRLARALPGFLCSRPRRLPALRPHLGTRRARAGAGGPAGVHAAAHAVRTGGRGRQPAAPRPADASAGHRLRRGALRSGARARHALVRRRGCFPRASHPGGGACDARSLAGFAGPPSAPAQRPGARRRSASGARAADRRVRIGGLGRAPFRRDRWGDESVGVRAGLGNSGAARSRGRGRGQPRGRPALRSRRP